VKPPKQWEFTLGAEREVVQGVALALDGIYRRNYDLIEAQEVNRVWNSSGSLQDPTGPWRDGNAQTYTNLDNAIGSARVYRGATLSIYKREGKLKTNSSYTLSTLKGNILDSNFGFTTNGSQFGDNAARDRYLYGYLDDDSRHVLKMQMLYLWTSWFQTGVVYSYFSGRPYSRRFRNEVTGNNIDYRAAVGIDPGSDLNDPGDDRPVRRPDINTVNLQVRFDLKPITKFNAQFFVDALNVLGLRTTTGVEQNDGPNWGRSNGRMAAMRLRAGFAFKY
jgi:hypothetical protein